VDVLNVPPLSKSIHPQTWPALDAPESGTVRAYVPVDGTVGEVVNAFSSAPSPLLPLLSAPAATANGDVVEFATVGLSASIVAPSFRSPTMCTGA
jgi:hypothetical protein